MATKKNKAMEKLNDELAFELLNKDVAHKYLLMRLEKETDEEIKKQIQVQADKAQKNLDDVTQLVDFIKNDYKA